MQFIGPPFRFLHLNGAKHIYKPLAGSVKSHHTEMLLMSVAVLVGMGLITATPLAGSKHHPIGPGTDQGLYNEGFLEGDIVPTAKLQSKNAVADKDLLWPLATIVYRTEDGVGCPESPQCEILMRAMEHYHQHSCIRFKEWTGEDNYVTIFFNPDSGACWSPVGCSGDGEQHLSLGQRCWYFGIVVHELGHAVGFWHEMNRPDRDDWIYVYWRNIIEGFSSAFSKHDISSVDTLGENFDYRSIMMYDEYAFSKDGVSATLQAKQPGMVIGPIWKKHGLSKSDVQRIHKLYTCNGNKPKRGFPYNVHCYFNKDTCGFKNGGSAVWNWRNINNEEGYVYSSYDIAGTTPGYFLSVNMHPTTKGNSNEVLGCARFWYLLESNGDASLKLSQAYLEKVTQLNYDPDLTFDIWESEAVTRKWIHVEVPIYVTKPFKLIFISGFNETCSYGTIAMDDIEIFYTPCGSTPTTTQRTPAKIPISTVLNPTSTSSTTISTLSTTSTRTTTSAGTTTYPSTTGSMPTWQPSIAQINKPTSAPETTPQKPVTIFPTDFLTHSI